MESSADAGSFLNTTVMPKSTLPPLVGVYISIPARVIFIIVGLLEIIVGSVGNSLLLSVVLQRRSLRIRSVHKFFIANLALSDLITTGYWMVFFIFDLILGFQPVVNMTHCIVNGYIICICFVVTAMSLTSITLNRYLHVCHDRIYTRIFSTRTTIAWCVMIWVVTITMMTVPPLLGYGSYHYNIVAHFCGFNRKDPNPYVQIIILFFALAPMVVIGYWNWAIFRYWKKTRAMLYKDGAAVYKQRRSLKGKLLRFWRSGLEESSKTETTDSFSCTQNTNDDKDQEETQLSSQQESDCMKPTSTTSTDNQTAVPASSFTTLEVPSADNQDFSDISDMDSDIEGSREEKDGEPGATRTATGQSNELHVPTKDQARRHSPALLDVRKLSSKPSLTPQDAPRQQPQRSSRIQRERAKEMALVRSLRMVFYLMVLAFVPFGTTVAVNYAISVRPPPWLVIVGVLFLFINNAVNWIVYGAMNKSFRHGYARRLRCCLKLFSICRPKRRVI